MSLADNAQYLLDEAYKHSREREFIKAIHCCREALEIDQDNADVYKCLGIAYLQEDTQRISNAAHAEKYFRKALSIVNDDASLHFHLALSIRIQGREGSRNNSENVKHFRKAVELDPNWSMARYEYAKSLFLEDRLKEAEEQMVRALELDASNTLFAQELEDIRYITRSRKTKKKKLNRWPALYEDICPIEQAVEKYLVKKDKSIQLFDCRSKVVTFGSCFAGNISRALRGKGINSNNITVGEYINSSYANLEFLAWLCNEPVTEKNLSRLKQIFDKPPIYYRQLIEKSDLVILTLGVAPCFFSLENNEFILPRASQVSVRSLGQKYEFRTTTVKENTHNIEEIISRLRIIKPDVQVVLTLSPVPLSVTFEYDSVIEADCVSKSTLRVAIDEVLRKKISNLHYWPSFEIVKWLGVYRGDAYGKEDNTTVHVSEYMIDVIVNAFIHHYSLIDL